MSIEAARGSGMDCTCASCFQVKKGAACKRCSFSYPQVVESEVDVASSPPEFPDFVHSGTTILDAKAKT